MNTSVFTVHFIGPPVTQVVYNLGRFTRGASRVIAHPAHLGKPRRLLASVASSFFMAGCPLMAQTFTPSSAPAQNWVSLAASADGTHLAAVGSYGYLYVSADSGATWTVATTVTEGAEPQRPWQAVASSADGSKLVAVANLAPVFTSADYGHTWTTNGPAQDWGAVASSADGTKLVAVDYNMGGVYTSTDSGLTWQMTSAPTNRWRCVASSADGAKLVAGTDFGDDYNELPAIYTSTDSGATWSRTGAPAEPWQTITSSADGTHLAAGVYGGLIYLSNDAGANWTPANVPELRWGSLCSSGHGNQLVAAAWEGQIYISTDAGHTWTAATAPQAPWQAVACTFDGSKVFAGIWNTWDGATAGIYTAQTLTPTSNTSTSGTGPTLEAVPAPKLAITLVASEVVVSWPASASGFQLQQTSAVTASTWADVQAAPSLANGRDQVIIPVASGGHFFRLVRR